MCYTQQLNVIIIEINNTSNIYISIIITLINISSQFGN